MADLDWLKPAVDVGIALVAGLSGSWLTAYRMGRRTAKDEAGVTARIEGAKFEFDKKLGEQTKQLEATVRESEKNIEENVQQLTHEFGETFKAMRQKINDVELASERTFLKKGEFEDFRKEYRDNEQRKDEKLDKLLVHVLSK